MGNTYEVSSKQFNLTGGIAYALAYGVDHRTGELLGTGPALSKAFVNRGLARVYGSKLYLTPWGKLARDAVRRDALMIESPILSELTGARTWKQILLGSNLSATMIVELLYGRRPNDTLRLADDSVMLMTKGTEKALVARGLVHPVQSTLTPLGVAVVAELLAAK